jgi:hypothetical protein
LVFVQLVDHLMRVVTKKSPIASQFTDKLATEFLGDAMECAFREKTDPDNKSTSLVADFLERWQFPKDLSGPLEPGQDMSIQQIFDSVQLMSVLEVSRDADRPESERRFLSAQGVRSHSWLP